MFESLSKQPVMLYGGLQTCSSPFKLVNEQVCHECLPRCLESVVRSFLIRPYKVKEKKRSPTRLANLYTRCAPPLTQRGVYTGASPLGFSPSHVSGRAALTLLVTLPPPPKQARPRACVDMSV